MVRFAPTNGGNDLALLGMIRREAGSPPGPTTYTPGQGYVEVLDASGTRLFGGDPEGGVELYVHGATRSLPGIIETKASTNYVDGNVSTLRARDDEQQIDIDSRAKRDYVDGNIRTLVSRDGELQDDINTRATRTYVDGNISTLVGRANSADSRLDGHDTAIAARATKTYVDGNVSTIVGRLNGHDSDIAARATRTYVDGNVSTLSSRITTAQTRADNAYSLAQDALTAGNDAKRLAGQIDTWLRRNTGYPTGGLNPNS